MLDISRIRGLFWGAKPLWLQHWWAADVYFENCIIKPCQVGHRQRCVWGEASEALASGPPFLRVPLEVLRA